jgi:hypothetical protein
MQAKEYRRRVFVLLLILALPVVFFSSFYYTASDDAIPLKVPERSGVVEKQIPARETWPVATALMGVAWAAAAAAFFSVAGSLALDRRLVQAGYRAWQILTARLVLLAGVSVVLSFAALIIFAVLTTSQHPELAWLSALVAGLTATAIGLSLGTLLPRPTEGMIILIGIFGTLMSMPPDSMRYVPTYASMQLFLAGRFGEDPAPGPFLLEGAVIIAVLTGIALLLWSWKTRVVRS